MAVTTVSFLVRPIDLSYESSIDKAISDNLWLKLPPDLKQYIPIYQNELKSFTVKSRRSRKREVNAYLRKNPRHFQDDELVALEFRAKWTEEFFQVLFVDRQDRGLDEKNSRAAAARMLSNLCMSFAQKLIVIMNISSPGYAKTSFSVRESKGLLFEGDEGCFSWLEYACYNDENPLNRLAPIFDDEPQDYFEWAKELKGFWNGLPSTNVERAMSYFSYMFTREHQCDLFQTMPWTIGCLDALYCESSGGISEKLKIRIPIILKDLDEKEISKTVNKIYQDRSRIVHGDAKFIANFSDPYDLSDEGLSHMNLFQSIPAAFYLIIRTLRFCVKNDRRALIFVEAVED